MDAFQNIVPYLTHPLALIGFVLLVFFGVHRTLIGSGVIPPVTQRTGGRLLHTLLRYGFVIAVLVIVLGFGLQFFKTHKDAEKTQAAHRAELAEQALKGLEQRLREKESEVGAIVLDARQREEFLREQNKTLTEAVSALAKQQGPGIDDALEQLAQGKIGAAEVIFQKVLEQKAPDIQEAAAAARHLGALAFLDDTEKALTAYRRATELDPDNPDGWNQLGYLLVRVGQLPEAEAAYRKVAALGRATNDMSLLAAAYTNLGNLF